MSHYYIEKAFKPIIVSVIENLDSGFFEFYVISDSLNSLYNITLKVEVKSFEEMKTLKTNVMANIRTTNNGNSFPIKGNNYDDINDT